MKKTVVEKGMHASYLFLAMKQVIFRSELIPLVYFQFLISPKLLLMWSFITYKAMSIMMIEKVIWRNKTSRIDGLESCYVRWEVILTIN